MALDTPNRNGKTNGKSSFVLYIHLNLSVIMLKASLHGVFFLLFLDVLAI